MAWSDFSGFLIRYQKGASPAAMQRDIGLGHERKKSGKYEINLYMWEMRWQATVLKWPHAQWRLSHLREITAEPCHRTGEAGVDMYCISISLPNYPRPVWLRA